MAKKERINYHKTLPTLKELVESNMEIYPEKMYDTTETEIHEDSCVECTKYSGNIILEMRKIGIDEYNKKNQSKGLFHRFNNN